MTAERNLKKIQLMSCTIKDQQNENVFFILKLHVSGDLWTLTKMLAILELLFAVVFEVKGFLPRNPLTSGPQ